MSKLQLLAQKRKQLAAEAAIVSDAPSTTSTNTGLSSLLQKRKLVTTTTEQRSPTKTLNSLSALLLKKKEFNLKNKELKGKESLIEQIVDTEPSKVVHDIVSEPENTTPIEKKITFENYGEHKKIHQSNELSKIQSKPTHILPQIIFSNNYTQESEDFSLPNPKRRKVESIKDTNTKQIDTNNSVFITIPADLAQKITKNFTNPSPDDKRKIVESLSEKVSKVNLEQEKTVIIKKEPNATKPKSKINIQQEIQIKATKPLLSFIVIGHVDSGKSTTIGRLLYDLGIVDSRTLHKLTRDAELAGKGSFSLAWVMDQTPEERSRGVTIDIVQTQFETNNMRFAVIDSPGHRDYVPQMINGITQADVAVVIIDATSDLIFESSNINNNSISSDLSPSEIAKGQTFEQLAIAKNLGIERVLIVINKMDVINWDQDRFDLIKDSLSSYLVEKLNFSSKELEFIPASGFKGDNIVKKSNQCTWYKDGTLIEQLEKLNEITHKSLEDLTSNSKDPFVLTITDITSSSGSDTSKKIDQLIIHGRVNSGILQPGETIKLWPSGETGQVESVSINISQIGELAKKNNNTPGANIKLNEKIAVAGEFVELKVRKIELPEAISIGDIATKITSNIEPTVEICCTNQITCELTMFGLTRPVLVGTPFVLFRGNVSYAAKLSSIEWVETKIINEEDGTIKLKKNKKRKHLSSAQRGKVIIETEKMIPVVKLTKEEKSTENEDSLNGLEKLKRIVLRKEGMTVGAGQII